VDEAFCSPPPLLPSSTSRAQQSIKEEGIRAPSFPIGVAFEINDTHTIEIENVKFIHEKVSER
jgi:hypothetical protein